MKATSPSRILLRDLSDYREPIIKREVLKGRHSFDELGGSVESCTCPSVIQGLRFHKRKFFIS
jgi:hypothetical protein